MEHLQQLIKSLSKSEKKMVRKFLSAYSSNGKSDTLSLQLFDLLNSRTVELSNKECSMILFGKDEKNRIRVLKSRVKSRLLDALTTDIVLESRNYDPDVKLSIQLKKKLAQFQTLLYSGKQGQKISLGLLDNIIEKSKTHEHYTIELEALQIKKLLIGLREGYDVFISFDKLILQAQNANMTKSFMVNSYYSAILKYRTKGLNHTAYKKELQETIRKGNSLLKLADSTIGRYYFNITKYIYCSEIKDYNKAVKIMEEQLDLLNTSVTVFRGSRLGATYDYISQAYILQSDYEKAIEFAAKGRECFSRGSVNYAVAEELEFRSQLYSNDLKKAESCLKRLRKNYKRSDDISRLSIHKFFLANIHFENRNFTKCKRLLNTEKYNFKKEKTSWEFNLRLLQIMAHIEDDEMETAYNDYYNLNRIVNKYQKRKQVLSSRNKLILKVLKKWLSDGGNNSISKLKNLALIEGFNKKANLWDPLNSELIPFDKWIKEKI